MSSSSPPVVVVVVVVLHFVAILLLLQLRKFFFLDLTIAVVIVVNLHLKFAFFSSSNIHSSKNKRELLNRRICVSPLATHNEASSCYLCVVVALFSLSLSFSCSLVRLIPCSYFVRFVCWCVLHLLLLLLFKI